MDHLKPLSEGTRPLLITQLTALWALNEAVLGGVLHGFKIPITGITIGSVAVLLVCLIGYFGKRGDVLKATLVVCIIKAMLSPHTPLPAYLAVLFQGGVGALLVSGRRLFTFRCVVFAVLALLESALQKLLMLTILFGIGFWQAADEFISKLLKQLGARPGPYALYIVGAYLLLHLLAGIGVGLLAGRLPHWLRQNQKLRPQRIIPAGDMPTLQARQKKPSIKVRPFLMVIWLLLAGLLVQAWVKPQQSWLPAAESLRLLVRSVVLLLAWYLVVGPVLLRLFKRWLEQKQGALKAEVQAVITLMPATLALARQCWKSSASDKGTARLRSFLGQMAVNLFPLEDERQPVR